MKIAAGIITINSRLHGNFQRTRAELDEESGRIMPRVHVDHHRSGCWQAWLGLLREMIEWDRGATDLLLCEDDVYFSRGLFMYLRHNPPPAGSIANLFCTPECHSSDLMRWHPQPCPARAQGSLALLIPLAVARKLAAAPPFPDRRDGTDHNIGTFCREYGIPFVTHSPSLVLHATTETSLTEARGRDENRQAFCFAESLNAHSGIGYGISRPPVSWPIDGIGEFPSEYSARRLYDSHSSRRRLPQHPHTLTVYYRKA